MILVDVERLREIAEVEFAGIHDNAPHKRWQSVTIFPRHFHNGSETAVSESYISAVPEEALREFLAFVRNKIGALSG